jgi:hypothetical protein
MRRKTRVVTECRVAYMGNARQNASYVNPAKC